MKRSVAVLGSLALLAAVIAFYCFSGYAMSASFSVAANGGRGHSQGALLWACAGLVSLTLALALAVAAWRQSRSL
jgi:hypothetical protein